MCIVWICGAVGDVDSVGKVHALGSHRAGKESVAPPGKHPRMYVVTSAEMAELDRRAEEEFGVPTALLMENAGRRVAEVVHAMVSPGGGRCVVLAGKGRNGGGGRVAARHLAARGWKVDVLLLAREDEIKGEARRNMTLAREAGVELMPVSSMALAGARGRLSGAAGILDAVFGPGGGSGRRRGPRGADPRGRHGDEGLAQGGPPRLPGGRAHRPPLRRRHRVSRGAAGAVPSYHACRHAGAGARGSAASPPGPPP